MQFGVALACAYSSERLPAVRRAALRRRITKVRSVMSHVQTGRAAYLNSTSSTHKIRAAELQLDSGLDDEMPVVPPALAFELELNRSVVPTSSESPSENERQV